MMMNNKIIAGCPYLFTIYSLFISLFIPQRDSVGGYGFFEKLIILLLSLFTLFSGCYISHGIPEYQANWSKLQMGMSKKQVIDILGEPSSKQIPGECNIQVDVENSLPPAPLEVRNEINDVLNSDNFFKNLCYEHWEYGKFGLFENLFIPSDNAYVIYFDKNGKVLSFREPLEYWEKAPYYFQDISPTKRIGGDYLDALAERKEGNISSYLKPPILLYPDNDAVFCHFPRELVFRWQPARGTPRNVEYLVQIESTSEGNFEKFGTWTDEPPFFTYRTGKTSLNDRFDGARPGRWRVKTIDKNYESEWSSWCYFRFSR